VLKKHIELIDVGAIPAYEDPDDFDPEAVEIEEDVEGKEKLKQLLDVCFALTYTLNLIILIRFVKRLILVNRNSVFVSVSIFRNWLTSTALTTKQV